MNICLAAEVNRCRATGKCISTIELAKFLATHPLSFLPGDHWQYSYCADVTGAVIECTSGKSFGQFLQDNIFSPLGMKDAHFILPEVKRSRLVDVYERRQGELIDITEEFSHRLGLENATAATRFESGGAGLVCSIDDYAKFVKMLQNGGAIGNERLLSPYGMKYYTAPQMLESQMQNYYWGAPGQNYATLMMVMPNPGHRNALGNIGQYGWGGWLGTNFFIDPVENLTLLFMTQGIGSTDDMFNRLKNLLYSCLE